MKQQPKVNKENKLVISKKNSLSQKNAKILYVNKEIHDRIKKVSEKTGNSIVSITTQLLLYGLENIEYDK